MSGTVDPNAIDPNAAQAQPQQAPSYPDQSNTIAQMRSALAQAGTPDGGWPGQQPMFGFLGPQGSANLTDFGARMMVAGNQRLPNGALAFPTTGGAIGAALLGNEQQQWDRLRAQNEIASGQMANQLTAGTLPATLQMIQQSADLVNGGGDAFGLLPSLSGASYGPRQGANNRYTLGNLVDYTLQNESGGEKDPAHARSATSSAYGPAQITDGDLQDYVKAHPAQFAGKSPQEISEMRTDMGFSRNFIAWRLQNDSMAYASQGIEPSAPNLRLSYIYGIGDAPKIILAAQRDPNIPLASVVQPASIKANPYMARMTVGDALNKVSDAPPITHDDHDTRTGYGAPDGQPMTAHLAYDDPSLLYAAADRMRRLSIGLSMNPRMAAAAKTLSDASQATLEHANTIVTERLKNQQAGPNTTLFDRDPQTGNIRPRGQTGDWKQVINPATGNKEWQWIVPGADAAGPSPSPTGYPPPPVPAPQPRLLQANAEPAAPQGTPTSSPTPWAGGGGAVPSQLQASAAPPWGDRGGSALPGPLTGPAPQVGSQLQANAAPPVAPLSPAHPDFVPGQPVGRNVPLGPYTQTAQSPQPGGALSPPPAGSYGLFGGTPAQAATPQAGAAAAASPRPALPALGESAPSARGGAASPPSPLPVPVPLPRQPPPYAAPTSPRGAPIAELGKAAEARINSPTDELLSKDENDKIASSRRELATLGEMQAASRQNQGAGFLQFGYGMKERAETANAINLALQSIGIKPAFDPDKLASYALVSKDGFKLAIDSLKSAFGGSREAGFIIQKASEMVPNGEMTPEAFNVVLSARREAAQAAIDEHNYGMAMMNSGQLRPGWRDDFAAMRRPESYVNRGLSQLGGKWMPEYATQYQYDQDVKNGVVLPGTKFRIRGMPPGKNGVVPGSQEYVPGS
jgi:hypothetical protein